MLVNSFFLWLFISILIANVGNQNMGRSKPTVVASLDTR
jgi:hypothetical protein